MIINPSAWGPIAAALVLCGCAAGNAAHPATGAVHTSAGSAAPSCVRDTGDPLAAATFNCAPGRTYSKSDIDSTGATTAGGALRLLDPSISIGH